MEVLVALLIRLLFGKHGRNDLSLVLHIPDQVSVLEAEIGKIVIIELVGANILIPFLEHFEQGERVSLNTRSHVSQSYQPPFHVHNHVLQLFLWS